MNDSLMVDGIVDKKKAVDFNGLSPFYSTIQRIVRCYVAAASSGGG